MIGIRTNKVTGRKNRNWKDNFYFTIKKGTLKEFKERIGFSHPKKLETLNFALNTQNRKQRTRDLDVIKQEILRNLFKNKKTTLEIANNVELTLAHTLRYLKILEVKGKILRSGFKNKSYWSLNQGLTHLTS